MRLISNLANKSHYSYTQDEADKDYARSQGVGLRKFGHEMITVIVDYLDSTPSVDPGDRNLLESYKARVNKVLFESKDNNDNTLVTSDAVLAELEDIHNLIGKVIITPFQFELDAGLSASDVSSYY